MTTNGNAALRLVAFEPASTPVLPVPPAKPDVSTEIGTAVASAASALCVAIEQHSEGRRLSHEVREAGGERIGKVVMLKMSFFDEAKFDAIAHCEGKRVMQVI